MKVVVGDGLMIVECRVVVGNRVETIWVIDRARRVRDETIDVVSVTGERLTEHCLGLSRSSLWGQVRGRFEKLGEFPTSHIDRLTGRVGRRLRGIEISATVRIGQPDSLCHGRKRRRYSHLGKREEEEGKEVNPIRAYREGWTEKESCELFIRGHTNITESHLKLTKILSPPALPTACCLAAQCLSSLIYLFNHVAQ
jgi:hypothetical protein